MGQSLADRNGGARVALIGSGSTCGQVVRRALIDFGVSGSRVDLYGVTHAKEPVIGEYDGEARLIQTPELEDLAARDLIFLCESGAVVDELVELHGANVTIVDVAHARPAGKPATIVHMDVNPSAAVHQGGLLAVPHDLSTLLVDLLHPLESEFGCEDVAGFVLRPASDLGQAGIDELRRQTLELLSFTSPEAKVFGRQLAFNIVPQVVVPGNGFEPRVADEVGCLLGWNEKRLALSAAYAPVFFGHTVQLRLRTTGDASAERIRAVLDGAGLIPKGDEPRSTPIDVSTEQGRYVANVADDGAGGFWLWAVAGETHVRNAELAVRLADALCGL
jgi:aspartate-semialdehyde dehydrogenase